MFVLKKTYDKLNKYYEELKKLADEALKQRDDAIAERDRIKNKLFEISNEFNLCIDTIRQQRIENEQLKVYIQQYKSL